MGIDDEQLSDPFEGVNVEGRWLRWLLPDDEVDMFVKYGKAVSVRKW